MKKPVIIAIAGGTASGKTTVANEVIEATKDIGRVIIMRLDDYYKSHDNISLEERKTLNYDHPDSIDWELLFKHLSELKKGHEIPKPIYDFAVHNRKSEVEFIGPADVIIVEGILALSEKKIRNLADIKLYVDTPDDLRFIRRLERDINERGRSVESVIEQYQTTVRPMHIQFVEPSKRYADIIIPNGGRNPIVIDFISTKISSIIRQEML